MYSHSHRGYYWSKLDRWRWHFLLKSSQPKLMTRVARYIAERCPVPSDSELRLVVDRDPVSLL